MRALKILFVSPEVEPFVKVGGLAAYGLDYASLKALNLGPGGAP